MKHITSILCTAAFAGCSLFATSHARAQNDDDKKFIAGATQDGVNEIALAKLAEKKAMNPDVKNFAALMIKEHTQMGDSLSPYAKQWGVTVATGPDADGQKEWDKLNKLSGKAFDKEYIDFMVSGHSKALDDFTSECKNAKDPQFLQTVMNDKSMVAAHKNMAYDLKQKM